MIIAAIVVFLIIVEIVANMFLNTTMNTIVHFVVYGTMSVIMVNGIYNTKKLKNLLNKNKEQVEQR